MGGESPSFYDYSFNTIQVLAKTVRSLIRVSPPLPALVPGTLMIITKKKKNPQTNTSSITTSSDRATHHSEVFIQAVMTVKWITFGGRAARLLTSVPPDFGKITFCLSLGKDELQFETRLRISCFSHMVSDVTTSANWPSLTGSRLKRQLLSIRDFTAHRQVLPSQ